MNTSSMKGIRGLSQILMVGRATPWAPVRLDVPACGGLPAPPCIRRFGSNAFRQCGLNIAVL